VLSWTLFLLVYRIVPQARIDVGTASRPPSGPRCCGGLEVRLLWNLGRIAAPGLLRPLAFAVSLVLWAYVSSLVLVLVRRWRRRAAALSRERFPQAQAGLLEPARMRSETSGNLIMRPTRRRPRRSKSGRRLKSSFPSRSAWRAAPGAPGWRRA